MAHVPAVPLLIQFPVNGLGKVEEDGLRAWAPETYVGDLEDEAPGSCLPPGPSLVTAIGEVTQR